MLHSRNTLLCDPMTTLTRWDDLRLFLELFRAGTLKGAGMALGLDTSTASRRLAALEQTLDVRLFDRSREGLSPTAAAEELIAAAEDMEQGALALASAAAQQERRVEGVVRLTVPPGLAEGFLAPLLLDLRRRHGGLRFEVDSSTRVVDLGRRDADIAIRTVRPVAGDLVLQKLVQSPWVAVGARGRRWPTVKRWSDLPWVGWGPELSQLHAAKWLSKHVDAPLALRTNSIGLQLAAVAQGMVALIPAQYARSYPIEALRFAKPLVASTKAWPSDELWLVTHRALRHVPRIAATWEWLVTQLRDR